MFAAIFLLASSKNFHTEFIINRLGVFCQNASANVFSRMDCIIKTSPTHPRNPQSFIPLYTRDKLTDALHTVCFETDYKFITKRQMKKATGWVGFSLSRQGGAPARPLSLLIFYNRNSEFF